MMRTLRAFARCAAAAVVALAVPASAAQAQTSITLKRSVIVEYGQPIRLADIAEIEGDDAEKLGRIELVSEADTRRGGLTGIEVGMAQVRGALSAGGAKMGLVSMRGSSCLVRTNEVREPTTGSSTQTAQRRERTWDGPPPAEATASVRAVVHARLAAMYRVPLTDLRLRFHDRDGELLDAAIGGLRLDLQPGASERSGRVPITIYLYDGDRIVKTGTVSAEPQIRRSVAVAAEAVRRGRTITAETVRIETRWLAPSPGGPADPESVIGAEARSNIEPGDVITQQAVVAPLTVRRGDEVWVHVLSGGVNMKVRARAMHDAHDGEIVRLRATGGRREFDARMSGPGVAVMVVSPAFEPAPPTNNPNTTTTQDDPQRISAARAEQR